MCLVIYGGVLPVALVLLWTYGLLATWVSSRRSNLLLLRRGTVRHNRENSHRLLDQVRFLVRIGYQALLRQRVSYVLGAVDLPLLLGENVDGVAFGIDAGDVFRLFEEEEIEFLVSFPLVEFFLVHGLELLEVECLQLFATEIPEPEHHHTLRENRSTPLLRVGFRTALQEKVHGSLAVGVLTLGGGIQSGNFSPFPGNVG